MKIPAPDGTLHEGVRVGIVGSNEPFGEVQLADGSVLSIRLVVDKVYRIDDASVRDNEGHPIYGVQHHQVIDVIESAK